MTVQNLRLFIPFLLFQIAWSSPVTATQASPAATPIASGACPVTIPNGEAPSDTPYSEHGTHDWYGSGRASASLWLMTSPSDPIVPVRAFDPRAEGGHLIKTPFWRGEGSGPITLTGERLDAPSDLEPHIDAAWDGYPIP